MRVLIHQSPGILAHPLSYRSPLIIAFDPGFNNPGRYAPEPSTASILANGKLSLSLSLSVHVTEEENKGNEIARIVDERRNAYRAGSFERTGNGVQTVGGVELHSGVELE